ncbi:MAG TPA: hypothetical protein VFO89_02340, partial [Thermoanaerobaculia bacterium]|nr:hypothetical protein [Thermoanaerobaculia bacterium]
GDLDVERTVFTEGRPFTFDESVDADRDVVVAGAEVRITPRLTAEAEFSTDGETSQSFAAVRFSFGGPRRIAETAAIMSRSVDLGCVPRRTGAGCTEEGWGCLVMFPENDWPQYRAALGNPPVTLDGTATVRDGRLHYEFKAPLPADVTSIPVDRDTPLQNPIARSLGFEHLIIAAGNYAVNRAVGRHGSVDFEINLGTFPQVGARPKLKFKHASPGCNDPLGLCLIIPLRWTSPSESLTPEEVADGFGFGTMEVVDGKLYLTPHRPAALPDGTLPIDEDKRLEPDLALALGYKSITIKRGVYRMNMAYGEFGRAVMDIDVTPLDPPAPTAVPCSLYSHTTGFCKGCGVACNDGTNYPMNCAADIFTGPMGNVCGGQHHRYNRNEFGTPQLYRGVFDVSELDAEFHTYDPAGADSCANSATARFTQYVPRQ